MGELNQPTKTALALAGEEAFVVQTMGGRMHVRWDETARATPHGQLVFFAEFLATAGVFDRWVEQCPLSYTSPNASSKRDVLGTLMLGILSDSKRCAHIAGIRGDTVAAQALGMQGTVSEDSVRRDTLDRVREVGVKVCSGGIVGMGESRSERAGLIAELANLYPYPESVPINELVQVEGTPLHGADKLDPLEFVRTIAVARITMPRARVRLSAGCQQMSEVVQALCFLAGANSVFYGDKLLTTGNPDAELDRALFAKLGPLGRRP